MADRGRDLKFSLLSDVDRFDLGAAADQLDDVADGAQDMGRGVDKATDELKRLAAQGRDAQRELDRMGRDLDDAGDQASKTAKKVDTAFERIADSSKSNLRHVGDDADRGMRHAGEATETFRDEARQNLSEVASSFTGSMDSAVDVVQGTLGGIVGDLGPLGAAVGAAGAAAVGLIYAKVQEAREAVKELAGDLIDAGGRLGTDDIFSRIRDKVVENQGDIERLVQLSKELGLASSDVAVAFSGSSAEIEQLMSRLDAMRRPTQLTTDSLEDMLDNVGGSADLFDQSTDAVKKHDSAITRLSRELEPYLDQAKKAEEAQRLFTQATGVSTETLSNYQDAVATVGASSDDLATATQAAAQRQADSTKSTTDTWETYRDTAVASIDDVIAAQERSLEAATNFQENSDKVFAAVGQAGLDWALSQGENADKAMQLLANAPAAKQQEIVANYEELGRMSGLNLAQGLTGSTDTVTTAAQGVHHAAQDVFGRRIDIPVGIAAPTPRVLAQARANLLRGLGEIVVPVKPGTPRSKNTADNSRYR